MNEKTELAAAIAAIWNELETALGDEWHGFRGRLWPLLRRLESGVGDEAETIDEIRSLFRQHDAAERLLSEALGVAEAEEEAAVEESPVGARGRGAPTAAPAPAIPDRYTVVSIMYGTDRAATGRLEPGDYYSGARGDGQLAYGTAEVSIPDDHRMGELEAPSLFRLQFRATPEKHVMVLGVTPLNEDGFVGMARGRLAGADKNDVLVFVHGYNVAFDDAARRCAQVAYDLNFPGVPFLYSWPSEGQTSSYTIDEANVMWTRPHFKRFVNLLLTQLGAKTVNVIAHSMGNRALAEMLDDFDPSELPDGAATLHQVVFAAPDIDAQTFEELAAEFQGRAKRFTLYASSKDLALGLSKKVHRYGRAGAVGVVSEVIDTVDASTVDTDMLGHSYFGDSQTVISDLFKLINHDMPPEKREGLEAVTVEKGQIWRFRA